MDSAPSKGIPIRRILVPLDGSPIAKRALPYALGLALPGSQILLLLVMSESRPFPGALVETADSMLRRNRLDALQDLVATATDLREAAESIRAVASVAVGDPAREIVRVACDRAADVIVMTSHCRGALGRVLLGSVAGRVARSSSVPVLVTRPDAVTRSRAYSPIHRLVVPLDGSELATQAIPTAKRLARELGVPILLISVVDSMVSPALAFAHPVAASQAIYAESLAGGAAERMLENAATNLRTEGITVEDETLRGPAATSIIAATLPTDLVVMTSHGRSGVRRWLLGSVAETLVSEGRAPVLLLRSTTPDATFSDIDACRNLAPVAAR